MIDREAMVRQLRLHEGERLELQFQSAEIRRIKVELKRLSEERDIPKKAVAYFT